MHSALLQRIRAEAQTGTSMPLYTDTFQSWHKITSVYGSTALKMFVADY